MADQYDELLTTEEAAARLGVKPATLYAYVSRGVLRSRRRDGRTSLFAADEIERLARTRRRAEPELVIASAITLIHPDGHRYRGHRAASLAETRTFEQVAELLWTGALPKETAWQAAPAALAAARRAQTGLARDVLPLERLALVTAAIATTDPLRHDTSAESVRVAARSLLPALVLSLPRRGDAAGATFAEQLWPALTSARPRRELVRVVNAALVLLADHELAASALAARVAASMRAHPYAVVEAALGAMQAPLHGAASLPLEELLAAIERPEDASRAIGDQLRRGGKLIGFGHPLYPKGDPRAAALLRLLRRAAPGSRALAVVEAVLRSARTRGLGPPNSDFALAALTRVAGFAPGAGEAIFALGRTAGWIAHALEEYEQRSRLRLRAAYVGPLTARG